MIAMLTTSCETLAAFVNPDPIPTEAEKTLCTKLAEVLPTYVPDDTLATREQGVKFLTRFHALCPGFNG